MKKKNFYLCLLLAGATVALAACSNNEQAKTTNKPATIVPSNNQGKSNSINSVTPSTNNNGGNKSSSTNSNNKPVTSTNSTNNTNSTNQSTNSTNQSTNSTNQSTNSTTNINTTTTSTTELIQVATVVLNNIDPYDSTKTNEVEVELDKYDESGKIYYADFNITNPTNEYKDFDGWYIDNEFKTRYDEGNGIESDLILYAKWKSKYATYTSGFDASSSGSITSWKDLVANTAFVDMANSTADITYGNFIFKTGNRIEISNNCVNTQGKDIVVDIESDGSTLKIGKGKWASSTKGGITITDSENNVKYQSEDYNNNAETAAIELENLAAGSYTISTTKSCRFYSISVIEQKELAPECEFEVASITNDNFLANTYTDAQELVKDMKLSFNALFANNTKEKMTDTSAIKFDCTNVDLTKGGTYEINVSYKNYETKKINVNIYDVDTISGGFYKLDANRVSLQVQKVFINGNTINYANLSLKVNGKCNELTHVFYLSDPTKFEKEFDNETKVVTIKYQGKNTTYNTYWVDKTTPTDGVITINVDANANVSNTTFKTITDALQYLSLLNLDNDVVKVINLAEGTYNEKVEVNITNVRIVGATSLEDADKYIITYNALAGQLDPAGEKAHSTDGSATFSVRSTAVGFSAFGVKFMNYYNDINKYNASITLEKAIMKDTQAVALLVEADQTTIDNCIISSFHDTLYARKGRQLYTNCYIEGRTDYIFSDNLVTAYFYNCTIHTLVGDVKDGVGPKNGGYIACTKGSAAKYDYIFDKCTFEADEQVLDGSVSLGRTWDTGMKLMIMNSNISKAYSKDDFGKGTDGKNPRYTEMNSGKSPKKENIFEYNNTGDGALSSAEGYTSVTLITDASTASAYNSLLNIFGPDNSSTYTSTWVNNHIASMDTTIEPAKLTIKIGENIIEINSYKNAYITKADIIDLVKDMISEGYVVDDIYTEETFANAFDFSKKISGDTELFVKIVNENEKQFSATTYTFANLTGDITESTKLGGASSAVTLIATSSKKFTVDGYETTYKDANGNEVKSVNRLKTGGASDSTGRIIEIDLSEYTGKVKIEVYVMTGSNSSARTGQIRKDSATGTSIKQLECPVFDPSKDTVQPQSVVVECGGKYYITADASINFIAINITPVNE